MYIECWNIFLSPGEPSRKEQHSATPRAGCPHLSPLQILLRRGGGVGEGRAGLGLLLPVVRQWGGPHLLRPVHQRILQALHPEEPRQGLICQDQ